MRKEPKKATRKIKDLPPDAETGANVKGGRDLTPDRKSVIRGLNRLFRPKS